MLIKKNCSFWLLVRLRQLILGKAEWSILLLEYLNILTGEYFCNYCNFPFIINDHIKSSLLKFLEGYLVLTCHQSLLLKNCKHSSWKLTKICQLISRKLDIFFSILISYQQNVDKHMISIYMFVLLKNSTRIMH